MAGATASGRITLPRRTHGSSLGGALLARGVVTTWLSIMVLVPLAALVSASLDEGLGKFWSTVTSPEAVASLKLTVGAALIVSFVNVIAGTIIAWVLVRDEFPGKRWVNALIDLPFALPTIVAGLTLLALYGDNSPFGVNIAFSRVGIVCALLFVTLPFVVRAVQPTLLELDRDMEDAAASLGAGRWTIFRRVVLPNLRPAISAGATLAFARAVGEFGSLILIAGSIPFKTEVASIFIFSRIESGDTAGAAAVSVVLLSISVLILSIMGWFGRRGLRKGGMPV